eukprot:TRINITY_DN2820_c0_g3_i1.p1 TRINITY_DN2820_c0_g3~~TRINITY_DN2820_c0_g3_i1.p1  ORF type:complete len:467 (+),score=60.41 TRINITY_DN2820_c0_g3_i1:71-1471(+)
MDEILVCWIAIAIILAFRQFTLRVRFQKFVHKTCEFLAPVFQWYTLSLMFLLVMVIRVISNFIAFEVIRFEFINPDMVGKKLDDLSEQFAASDPKIDRDMFLIPTWLRVITLISPLAGTIAFGMAATNAVKAVNFFKTVKRDLRNSVHRMRDSDYTHLTDDDEVTGLCHFMPTPREDLFLVIYSVPLVIIFLSMRGTLRALAVMTASASGLASDFDTTVLLETSTYHMCLELVDAFQFLAVWKFATFVQPALNPPEGYETFIKFGGLQGVYAYSLVGTIKCFGNLAITMTQEDEAYRAVAAQFQLKFETFLGPVFAFLTILCVANMILVSSLQDVKDDLPGCNSKFLGTRIMLLVSQLQLNICKAFVKGMPLYKAVRHVVNKPAAQKHIPQFVIDLLHRWTFSEFQANLLHSSLLTLECLFLVIFNTRIWDLKDKNLAFSKNKNNNNNNNKNKTYLADPLLLGDLD